MMCDVMPSISEDADQRDSMCSDGDIENGCYDDGCRMMEDTMMLDEKEELLESLREAQDNMAATQAAMQRLERERDSLYARLFTNQPVVSIYSRWMSCNSEAIFFVHAVHNKKLHCK
jgi:hypothetical protein